MDAEGYRVEIDVKRTRPQPDELALEQLLVDKNLWGQACKVVVDHDLVEQLYLEGKITDSDLRAIGAESKVTLALRVIKVED